MPAKISRALRKVVQHCVFVVYKGVFCNLKGFLDYLKLRPAVSAAIGPRNVSIADLKGSDGRGIQRSRMLRNRVLRNVAPSRGISYLVCG